MKTNFKSLILLFILSSFSNFIISQSILNNGKVNFLLEQQQVQVSANKVQFAKKIIEYPKASSDTLRYRIKNKYIEGSRYDNIHDVLQKTITLKKEQHAIFKFGKKGIKNVIGIDLYIFSNNLGKHNLVSISKDGKNWIEVGKVNSNKQYIELSKKIKDQSKFTFLKIQNKDEKDINLIQVASIVSKGSLGKSVKIKNGVIHSKSKKVYIKFHDWRIFDGDIITIEVNGKLLVKRKLLTKSNKYLTVILQPGSNKIVIKAKNEGLRKPNTVDVKIVDGVVFNIGSLRLQKGQRKSIEIKVEN